MELFRRVTLALLGVAFCLSLAVATGYSQPGRARWEGNRGLHRGWTNGRHRGWDNRGRRVGWNDYYGYRSGRLSWRERRRLARMRYRMYNRRNWVDRDVYYNTGERRRRAYRYRNSRYW